ncbi:MAG TPA: restriction endonuclease [Thermoleophilaceae bacterium]
MEFFVGSLAYEVTASDLAAFVGKVVEVNAAMVQTDRETGRSRGFGAIDVPDGALIDAHNEPVEGFGEGAEQEARERMALLNGQILLGRRPIVSRSRVAAASEPFLSGVRGALADDGQHVIPNEEQFRDVLDAALGRAQAEEVLTPSARDRVQSSVGSVTFIGTRVLDYLSDHRSELHELVNPRQFEELCHELLRRTGFYDLQLTQQSRDGGVDIYGTRVDRGQRNFYVVECKHWDPSNRVGSPIVQQTFGVMGLTQADKAMVVTSSYFTGPAIGWQAVSHERLILRNRDVLGAWIRAVRRGEPECMLWLPGDP